MSVIERIDMFVSSLPRTCLYCAYGFPIVWGVENFLDVQACVAHTVWGLRSKLLTAPKMDIPGCENKRGYTPLMTAGETCGSFEPCSPTGGAVARRKFRLLDAYGYFDDLDDWRNVGK